MLKYIGACLLAGTVLKTTLAFSAESPAHDASHPTLQPVPDGVEVPVLSIDISRDPVDGFNLSIDTDKWQWKVPGTTPLSSRILQGHAQLIINGNKHSRVYASPLHIPQSSLKNGLNQIIVRLIDDFHQQWTVQGQPIQKGVFINTLNIDPVLHYF